MLAAVGFVLIWPVVDHEVYMGFAPPLGWGGGGVEEYDFHIAQCLTSFFYVPKELWEAYSNHTVCPSVRYLQDGRSEVPNGPWPLQIYGDNLTRLNPQAFFNTITPYCTNPNLALTSLNTAVHIANLIMYRGHVQCRFVRPTLRPDHISYII